MKEIQFYRGSSKKYNKVLYEDCIFFATDTKEILLNGISYGSIDLDDQLSETSENPVKNYAIYKAIKDNIDSAIDNAPFGTSL
jgi:hypothetical protein